MITLGHRQRWTLEQRQRWNIDIHDSGTTTTLERWNIDTFFFTLEQSRWNNDILHARTVTLEQLHWNSREMRWNSDAGTVTLEQSEHALEHPQLTLEQTR